MESILNFLQSIPDSPSGVLDFVTGLLLAHGYLVIFLGAALDNFGLPSSGDVVLFAGGFFANQGQAALPLVMLVGFAGALVSDNAVYWIGRIGGRPLISRISSSSSSTRNLWRRSSATSTPTAARRSLSAASVRASAA